MDLKELRAKLWWSVDNGVNGEALQFLASGNDKALVNEALKDLAECLHIVKKDSTLLPNSIGVVSFPSDLMELQRVRYGDTDLTPIHLVTKILVDDDEEDTTTTGNVTKYMVKSNSTMELYETPPEIPSGLSVGTVGVAGVITYRYHVTAVTGAGESLLSAEVQTSLGNSTLDSSNYNILTWTAVSGAISYKVYRSTTGYLAEVTSPTYNDQGAIATSMTTTSWNNKKLHLWYKAYPVELNDDTDTPSDIPLEYHESLASVYGAAQFHKKMGDIKQYNLLMGLWYQVRKKVWGVMDNRAYPVNYNGDWTW